ncbi:hypothetical protein [Paenibacillus sp. FSL M7-0420]|uniref:hypothetical protein n=1 Tax=Paenibacillus sp. FSL M7-0420 TaxID=2921609 RepID=UPI0030F5E555
MFENHTVAVFDRLLALCDSLRPYCGREFCNSGVLLRDLRSVVGIRVKRLLFRKQFVDGGDLLVLRSDIRLLPRLNRF